jgi:Protein of unknown function (DUF1194)
MRTNLVRLAIQPAILALALALPLCGASAQSRDVDLALVLAVDCSGSVDPGEYELEMLGIARAFRDPEIIEAIERLAPNGVAISVVHWAGYHGQQVVAIDWTKIGDRASADALATRIEASERPFTGDTAIDDMLRFGIDHLENGSFQSARRVIDVSGDGESTAGTIPDRFRDAATAAGITINGLAILNEFPTLDRYYADHVIGGPDAFVISAPDYDDFARAMRQKLLQEIGGAPLG